MDDHINTTDHEADFLVWTSAQIELLRSKQFDRLDLENIIEELESMARAERFFGRHAQSQANTGRRCRRSLRSCRNSRGMRNRLTQVGISSLDTVHQRSVA
jgi:hypothetical protein